MMTIVNLLKAIQIAGSQRALAKKLGISQAALHHYLYRQKKVPASQVIKIERATGGAVTRYELRPDIYPPDER